VVPGDCTCAGAAVNVRIISGSLGGRKIEAPDNTKTHPMGERVRNALFNIIGDDVKGAEVLDAFAGTGAVGIEALSRGAHSAVFVESDRVAQNVLEKNKELLGLGANATIVHSTVEKWLNLTKPSQFDIIFADPPYDNPQFSTASNLLGLLKPNGLMVLSHPGRSETPTRTGVVVVDNRSYGTAELTFYRREDA